MVIYACDYHTLKHVEAIKGMDKVADYINEMQRIHDQHSSLFNKLMNQHKKVNASSIVSRDIFV